MVESFYSKKDEKLDFRQIILGHFKRILELACQEFRGGYFDSVIQANSIHKTYVTDKRAEFIQAIEVMAITLKPYFNENMSKSYKKYKEDLEELNEKYQDSDGFLKEDVKAKFSIKKLALIMILLENLGQLLKEIDYFVQQDYEDEDEIELADIDDPK